MNFINRLVNNVALRVEQTAVPNELIYDADSMNWSNIQLALSSKEERQRLLDGGIECGKEYLFTKNFPSTLENG